MEVPAPDVKYTCLVTRLDSKYRIALVGATVAIWWSCRVPCAVHHVPCTVYRVPCSVFRVPCAVCRVLCALCRVLCAVRVFVYPQVSLCLIGGGWQYCSRNMESTSVKCDMRSCDVTELKSGVLTKLTIPVLHTSCRMRCSRGADVVVDKWQ